MMLIDGHFAGDFVIDALNQYVAESGAVQVNAAEQKDSCSENEAGKRNNKQNFLNE